MPLSPPPASTPLVTMQCYANSTFLLRTSESSSTGIMKKLRIPGGSLEYFVYGGVHPIILGKKLLCYPIFMGSWYIKYGILILLGSTNTYRSKTVRISLNISKNEVLISLDLINNISLILLRL